jgi:rod shape determining protein RodA
MLKRYRVRDYDFKLVFMLIAITVIGILAIGSANEEYQSKQIIGMVAGVFLMILISLFDYHTFLRFYWLLYILNICLLVLVQVFGDSSNNAQRWVKIAGIRFQPSEVAKILLILFYAQYIMKHKENFNSFRNLLFMGLLFLPPFICRRTQLQNHFGRACSDHSGRCHFSVFGTAGGSAAH